MHDEKPPSSDPAEGAEFWKCVWEKDDRCETFTDEMLPRLGKKAPDTLIKLGTVASLLDRIASCWWGCAKGDHAGEYLVGRATTLLHGAMRLMRFGYYDEALNLVRSLGELANLMMLFSEVPAEFDSWKRTSAAERRGQFKPARIRRQLATMGRVVPMDDAHYAKLCDSVTHPTPGVRPQDYNPRGQAVLGGFFQPAGVMVVLNESALLTALVGFAGRNLITLPREARLAVLHAGKALVLATGSVQVTDLPELWSRARPAPG